jgi:hypothetical protein
MPVKYFAPKVTVKLCIIDFFPPRDNRGKKKKEQSECLLRPQLFITTHPGLSKSEHYM